MEKLRVGFIGAGRISTLHALEYLKNPRADLVAVCDVNPKVAAMQAREWGVAENRVYTDYHDLLALPEIDMVEILLPHFLHLSVTLDAFAAGKHVSLQKPMAMSLEDADEMIAASKKAGKLFKVFENFIFSPPMQRAKALLDEGEIGDPVAIRIKTMACTSPDTWQVSSDSWSWHHDPKQSGGGAWLTDDGHHPYALGWFYMGMAKEMFVWAGETKGPHGTVDAPCFVTWRYSKNQFGSWEAILAKEMVINTDYYAADDYIEITGNKGVIWVTRGGHGKMYDRPPVTLHKGRETRTFSDMRTGWEQGFMQSTRQYIDAILEGGQPLLTGEQGRDILRWCAAAEKSAVTGQPAII